MRWPWTSSATHGSDQFGTPLPRPWWRRNWMILAVVLVIVVGLGVWKWDPWNQCGSGLVMPSGESACVGLDLTGAGFRGDDQVASLDKKIIKADKKIVGKYATIVYLDDMVPDKNNDIIGRDVLIHRIEGVIAAQQAVNDGKNDITRGSSTLKIKVLLANYGSSAKHEGTAVQQIQNNVPSHHIVAVTGIGQSLLNTKKAINKLAKDKIVTVGSVTSGDKMDVPRQGDSSPYFFRVISSNRDEAKAAVTYIEQNKQKIKRVVLVKDTDPTDYYTDDLGKDFGSELTDKYPKIDLRTVSYNPQNKSAGESREDYLRDQFGQAQYPSCGSGNVPGLIYFAGRGTDLNEFLQSLAGGGSCSGNVIVFSGDDINQAIGRPLPPTNNLGIQVFYTAVATGGNESSEDEWNRVSGDSKDADNYNTFKRYFHFPSKDLDDGHAIMEYDALLTAATAARDDRDAITSPASVVNAFANFTCRTPVPGASGRIAFYNTQGNFANNSGSPITPGDPIDKAIPIMRLNPDGQATPVTVEWSDGPPFDSPAECG